MSQTAVLADGTRLEFPDETPADVIQATVKRMIAQTESGLPLPAGDAPSWTGRVMAGYKAVSEPITNAVARTLRGEEPGRAMLPMNPLAQLIPAILSKAREWSGGALPEPPDPATLAGPTRAIAEMAVPQTPAEAGMMLLGPAARAAMVAKLGPAAVGTLRQIVLPAAAAIGGSAAGGAGGAAISGEDPAAAAAQGAIGAGIGEGVGWAAGKVMRSGPGSKARVANKDAADVRAAVEELSPGIARAEVLPKVPGAEADRALTANERLHAIFSQPTTRSGNIPAREGMGALKEETVTAIEDALMGRKLNVPSLGERPVSIREANKALTEIGEGLRHQDIIDPALRVRQIREAYGNLSNEIRSALDAAQAVNEQGIAAIRDRITKPMLALPPRSEPGIPGPPRTFEAGPMREVASSELPALPNLVPMRTPGVRTDPKATSFDPPFGVPPARGPVIIETTATTARDVTPRPPADMRPGPAPWWPTGQAGDVPQGPLPEVPPLSAMWEAAQGPYRRGMGLIDFFSSPNAWRTGSKGVEINMNALQRALKNPEILAELTRSLGPEGVDRLAKALTRGAGIGRVDRLAAGEGQIGSSLGEWLRGSNTGSTTLLTTPLRALLPGVGDKYIGRVPYALPPVPQMTLDAATQRLIDTFTRE